MWFFLFKCFLKFDFNLKQGIDHLYLIVSIGPTILFLVELYCRKNIFVKKQALTTGLSTCKTDNEKDLISNMSATNAAVYHRYIVNMDADTLF